MIIRSKSVWRRKKRKTLNRFAKVEDEISNKESEVEELSKELENSDIATDYVKAGEITDKITELQDKNRKPYGRMGTLADDNRRKWV